ncbi:glycoside hydrolase family 18 protein [Embleya scabrispora]|uniref:glycoside hydrolase family 18 protein n=1 Tax=Embleya scabrispora TaxID=159449 RepID=UPI0003A4C6E1|nr:cellulose binding domain-containing protein [Embleya scabrispora]MYS83395.1 sugar hydrolase [Streptomyces sp. SID5474]
MGSHRASGPEPGAGRPRRERIRWAAASAALAALPAALVVALSGDSPGHDHVLSADYVRTGSWPTGYSGQYVLRNLGSDTVKGWTLRFDLPSGTRIANVWNGRLAPAEGKYTVRNENWNKALRPGESIVVGFEVRRDGAGAPTASEPARSDGPIACTINDKPCNVPAPNASGDRSATAGPVPPTGPRDGTDRHTATPTPAGTGRVGAPVTTSPAPTASGSGGGSAPRSGTVEHIAPYLDMTLAGPLDPTRAGSAGGVRERTLAYVVDGGGCRPMWGGVTRLDDPAITGRIAALRDAGGTIRVAFGGAGGTDLAASCGTPEELAAVYRQVLTATGATGMDLDIEGRSLVRPDVVQRRNAALYLLQEGARVAGRAVDIGYSLPVDPLQGLGEEAKALLRDAVAQRVEVSYVNVKALNYGAAVAPRPQGRMGQFASDAAHAVQGQIREVWPHLSEEQAWRRVSVTVMIGRNDVAGEVFTLDDARRFAEFARTVHLGRVAWWSVARDRPCPDGAGAEAGADPTCSGIAQDADAFLRILSG